MNGSPATAQTLSWDGFEWTPAACELAAGLYAVLALSDHEAWAVGRDSQSPSESGGTLGWHQLECRDHPSVGIFGRAPGEPPLTISGLWGPKALLRTLLGILTLSAAPTDPG